MNPNESMKAEDSGALDFKDYIFFALVAIGIIAIALLIRAASGRQSDPAIISQTSTYGAGTLTTVSHDGHWWIVGDSSRSGAVHHPDCPCQEARP